MTRFPRALSLALLLSLAALPAHAQQFPSGSIQANAGATAAPARATTPTAWLDRWCSSTNNTAIFRTSGTWGCSATIPSAMQDNITRLGTIVSGTWNGTAIASGFGGTGNAFFAVSGPATSIKTFTFPNANSTVAVLGTAQTWTALQGFNDGFLGLNGSTSGQSIVKAPATGGGTVTLFAGSDTVVGKATTDTLTNKTLTSPVLVTPALGTPASGTLTNATGLPISTGVSGLGTGVATALATPSSANLAAAVTDETGSGALVFATSPVLVTPALGTPASGTLTNATGLPISTGVSGLGTGVATALATPSSANIAAAVTDETGSGALVFATSPALVTPTLGVAAATTINKVTITAPATGSTLTIPDSVVFTGPAASGTAMTLGNAETVTGAKTFGSAGAVGRFKLAGTTSGTTIVDATAVASGTITIPAATDTLVGKATTDTLTNKTFDTAGAGNSFSINGVAATANTGTGSVVRATSPSIASPTFTGTVAGAGTLPLSILATQAADTAVVNASGSTASPTAVAIGSCSTASNALTYNTTTHAFGCNTISGSGTVNSGTAGQLGYYAASSTAISGNANATISGSDVTLGVAGSAVGTLSFGNATSGTIKLTPPTGALATSVLTLPIATDTLVGKATTDTLTNKTLTSPVLVTPALGTPASGTLTNATGLPISTGVSGLGTGVATALGVNVGTAGAPVVNGGALGTPASGTLTSATGLPISTGVSGLGTGVATALATPSSANIAAAVTDETGSGALVFATSPTLVTPALGTPASGTLTNATGLPISTGVSGLGTGVATALATPSSANIAAAVTDETGSGALVFATSPTLVTPTLGVASATTINKVALTQPATGSTITVPDGVTMTGPASSATVAAINLEGQTLSGGASVTSKSQTAGNITIGCNQRPLQFIQNTGAWAITADSSDGQCGLLVINQTGAASPTFSGFLVGSNTGDTFGTGDKNSGSCTFTSASPGVGTLTAHGAINGQPIYLTGTTAPTGLSLNTVYYAASVAANTFQLAATPGGSSINTSSTGTALTCHVASQFIFQATRINGQSTYSWKALQ